MFRIDWNDTTQLIGRVERFFQQCRTRIRDMFSWSQCRNDISCTLQCFPFGTGNMIGHTRLAGVNVGTTQVFGRNDFSRRSFDQGWTTKEDGTILLHNDCFIGHAWDVGTTRGTTTTHDRNLWYISGTHIGLIVKDPSKMEFIWKDLCLLG